MSTTPTTAAGRALYDDKRVHNIAQRTKADDEHDREWAASIVAVEDEARATRKLLGRSALAYLNEADAALAAEKERVARLLSEHAAEKSLIFDDLGAILRALGLFDGARPISGHDVVQTVILPAIEALAASAEPRWPSGEVAERELAAALRKVIGLAFVWADGWGPANDRDDADAVAHWTVEALAALSREPPREGSAGHED